MSDIIKCPRCNSDQLHVGEKGFSLGKASIGVITIGALGALAGLHGKNKIRLSCLECGYTWSPNFSSPTQNRLNLGQASRQYSYVYTKDYFVRWIRIFWGITVFNLVMAIVFIIRFIIKISGYLLF